MFPGDEVTAPHTGLIADGEIPPGTVLLYVAAPAAAQPLTPEQHTALVASIVKHCIDSSITPGMAQAWAKHAIREAIGAAAPAGTGGT
jgi:hypothetical protein